MTLIKTRLSLAGVRGGARRHVVALETPGTAAQYIDGEGELKTFPSVSALQKYTAGPAWSGAQYETIQEAVDAADADGHGATYGGVVISVYPKSYNEAVVIPETLRYWHLVGLGDGGNTGPFTASLTVNVGALDVDFSVSGFGITTVTVNQPVGGSGTWYNNFLNCWVFGAMNIVGPNLRTTLTSCRFYGGASTFTFNGLQLLISGSTFFSNSAQTTLDVASSIQSQIVGCALFGRTILRGARASLLMCHIDHDGSPAVTDETSITSFCQGNVFSHNAGPVGPVWVKTGAGNFHDGGNTFTEGQVYPWYDIQAGTRSDRAESDTQIRNVLEVSGSPVLTPAQVGGQRKTTVAKTDGGGAVSLPAIAKVEPGCTLVVKDTGNATATPFIVDVDGGGTIEGSLSVQIANDYESLTVQAGTTEWFVVSRANVQMVGRYSITNPGPGDVRLGLSVTAESPFVIATGNTLELPAGKYTLNLQAQTVTADVGNGAVLLAIAENPGVNILAQLELDPSEIAKGTIFSAHVTFPEPGTLYLTHNASPSPPGYNFVQLYVSRIGAVS